MIYKIPVILFAALMIAGMFFFYGFSSPSDENIFIKPFSGKDIFYMHSGDHRLVIQTEGKWSVIIKYSFWYDGPYKTIINETGSGNAVIMFHLSTRGNVMIIVEPGVSLMVIERLPNQMQWDYITEGGIGISVLTPLFLLSNYIITKKFSEELNREIVKYKKQVNTKHKSKLKNK